MPATESTWRSLKSMHVVFGVASVIMLLCTVWMLAADHNRSWKNYQREYRDIESWSADARINEQNTPEFGLTESQLQQKLEDVQGAALSDQGRQLFQKFVAEAKKKTDAQDSQQAAADSSAADFIAKDVETLAGYTDAAQRRDLRMDLYNRMRDLIARVKFREDNLTSNLKFRKAVLDKALASFSLAVGEGAPAEKTAQLQLAIDNAKADVDQLSATQQQEQTHRKELQATLNDITSEQDLAEKNLKEHQHKLEALKKTYAQQKANPGKQVLEMPILDAFNSPLKIDQIWLPDLTLNNNFKEVARFDHCTTCHQAIEKTAAGSAVLPAYDQAREVAVSLATPKEAPQPQKDRQGSEVPVNVEQVYGFALADRGMVDANDVTIGAVFPKSPAATAGLAAGDVLVKINDARVIDLDRALTNLLANVTWGQPLALTIRRGVPQPFSSHPRLDLFVGGSSPHPKDIFGCSICHQGQGSATSFEWASHTPNSPQQGRDWAHDYGWFNNHHWIFPMYPRAFDEASCLKCHHEVVDLEPSPKYPDPPAPTLIKGYELVRNYGCFGCHEINGFNGPAKRVGPDLRAEPAFYAAAQQVKSDSGFGNLTDEVKGWVERLIGHPDDDSARRRLREFLATDAAAKKPVLSQGTDHLEAMLKDIDTPGTFRKVGPSLRYVGSKDGYEFLYSWIRNPRDFRPSTKMPRFFGLWDHLVPTEKLDDKNNPVRDEKGNLVYEDSLGLLDAQRFEPVEVRAIANYLLTSSEAFDYLDKYTGTAKPSAERGKKAFEMRCIACHQHADFPQATATQGPNLSRIGAKLSLKPYGSQWLYSWIKNPSHYHARTAMPNTMLTPVANADGSVNDPIADVVEFLMQSTQDWKPSNVPAEQMTGDEKQALFDLALIYLKEKYPPERAKLYLQEGIPADRADGVTGAEAALLQSATPRGGQGEAAAGRALQYVGRRAISKYGCFGCHDIPGFEDAKPIGTALADWGRKDPSRLAFEQVGEYVTHYSWPKPEESRVRGQEAGGSDQESKGSSSTVSAKGGEHMPYGTASRPASAPQENMDYAIDGLGPTQGWLMEKLLGHEREGFLWEKLHQPRSYDFKKTENKGYNDRLRMPQFPFQEDEIEAVMTFVLGLVSEPPAPQYVANYAQNPREQAVIGGIRMVEQFNCTGCHQLEFEHWDLSYKSGTLGAAVQTPDYPFELPHFTQTQIDDSQREDRRGLLHAQLYGRPQVDAKGEIATTDENEEGDKFEGGGLGERFVLWQDMLLNGKTWLVGSKNPLVPENSVTAKFSGRGGDLGRWIYPAVVADEQKVNPNAKADEAWGWLPPPLIGEGKKVQTRWLHDFLLEPYPIRPAVVLRMPKFNMSSTNATTLVDFFAARDDAAAPYEFDARTSGDYFTGEELKHPHRMRDAMNIVTNNNYCVKCHLVGDFTPGGSVRAMGPQLDRVNERLRPDYVEHWVGNPKRILPYTGMPVNIPAAQPVAQDLFPGNSEQQLNGVVDLLMNWDRITKQLFSVKALIKPAAATGAGSAAAGASGGG
ncbi:MAG TPA: c-type cytochrome [Pirellulales bacterium]|jgi:mono/diheme cytochrome c family protein|nr:c-type cytochrome [Pirellulales bacterium]